MYQIEQLIIETNSLVDLVVGYPCWDLSMKTSYVLSMQGNLNNGREKKNIETSHHT